MTGAAGSDMTGLEVTVGSMSFGSSTTRRDFFFLKKNTYCLLVYLNTLGLIGRCKIKRFDPNFLSTAYSEAEARFSIGQLFIQDDLQ